MFKSAVKKSNIIINPLKKINNDYNKPRKTFLYDDRMKKINVTNNNNNKQLVYNKSEVGFLSKFNDDMSNKPKKIKPIEPQDPHDIKKEAFLQKLKDMIFSPGDINYYGKENEIQNLNIDYFNYERNSLKPTSRVKSSDKLYDSRKRENGATSSSKYTKNVKNSNFNNLKNFIKGNLLPNKLDKRKTLVLDLDETLIHSAFEPFRPKDDIKLRMKIKSEEYDIHVLKRPYLDKFLSIVTQKYEVVIFTASISDYANPLLDQLDPYKKISYRLFREHCTKTDNGLFIKDLNKLGRNLKDVIIIDNNPVSYTYNKMNGLPILTWHSIQTDNELIKLIPLLLYLTNVDDIRPIINKVVNGYYVNYKEVNKIIRDNNLSSNNNKEEDDYFNNWYSTTSKKSEKKEEKIYDKDISNINSNSKDKYISNMSNTSKKIKLSADHIIKYKGLLGSEDKLNFDNYKKARHTKMFNGFLEDEINDNKESNNDKNNINLESNKNSLFIGLDNNNKNENSILLFGPKLENKRAYSSSNIVKADKNNSDINNKSENSNIFNFKYLQNEREINNINNANKEINNTFNFENLNNSKLNTTDANISINKNSNYRNIIMNNNTNIINNNIYLINNKSFLSNTNNNTIEHSSRNIYNDNKSSTFKYGYQSANYFFNKKERAESAKYKQRQNNSNNKNILSDLIDNLINYNRNNKKKNIDSNQLISISNNKFLSSEDSNNKKTNNLMLNNIRTGREIYDKFNSRNSEKLITQEENKYFINAFLNNKISVNNIGNVNVNSIYSNTGNNFENYIQKNKKGSFLYGNNHYKDNKPMNDFNYRINKQYSNIRQNKTIKYLSPTSNFKIEI